MGCMMRKWTELHSGYAELHLSVISSITDPEVLSISDYSLARSLAYARHHHPQARIRRRAAWVANASLRWLDEAAQQEAISLLVPLLHDPDHKVRDAAHKAFRGLHDLPRPRSVVKTILEGCLNHLRHSALPWVTLSLSLTTSRAAALINCVIDVLVISIYSTRPHVRAVCV